MKAYILSDQRSNVHKRSRYYAWPSAASSLCTVGPQGWVWRSLQLYFYSLQRSVTWHPFSLLYFLVIWLRLLTLFLLILNSRMYFPPQGYCGWQQVSEEVDSSRHSSGKYSAPTTVHTPFQGLEPQQTERHPLFYRAQMLLRWGGRGHGVPLAINEVTE